MKPLIMKVNDLGKPVMTAEEIQKMVEEAYQIGFEDGKKQSPTITIPPDYYKKDDHVKPWWEAVRYTDHTVPLTDFTGSTGAYNNA